MLRQASFSPSQQFFMSCGACEMLVERTIISPGFWVNRHVSVGCEKKKIVSLFPWTLIYFWSRAVGTARFNPLVQEISCEAAKEKMRAQLCWCWILEHKSSHWKSISIGCVAAVSSFGSASIAELKVQMKQTCDSSELWSVWEFVLVLLMNSNYRIGL